MNIFLILMFNTIYSCVIDTFDPSIVVVNIVEIKANKKIKFSDNESVSIRCSDDEKLLTEGSLYLSLVILKCMGDNWKYYLNNEWKKKDLSCISMQNIPTCSANNKIFENKGLSLVKKIRTGIHEFTCLKSYKKVQVTCDTNTDRLTYRVKINDDIIDVTYNTEDLCSLCLSVGVNGEKSLVGVGNSFDKRCFPGQYIKVEDYYLTSYTFYCSSQSEEFTCEEYNDIKLTKKIDNVFVEVQGTTSKTLHNENNCAQFSFENFIATAQFIKIAKDLTSFNYKEFSSDVCSSKTSNECNISAFSSYINNHLHLTNKDLTLLNGEVDIILDYGSFFGQKLFCNTGGLKIIIAEQSYDAIAFLNYFQSYVCEFPREKFELYQVKNNKLRYVNSQSPMLATMSASFKLPVNENIFHYLQCFNEKKLKIHQKIFDKVRFSCTNTGIITLPILNISYNINSIECVDSNDYCINTSDNDLLGYYPEQGVTETINCGQYVQFELKCNYYTLTFNYNGISYSELPHSCESCQPSIAVALTITKFDDKEINDIIEIRNQQHLLRGIYELKCANNDKTIFSTDENYKNKTTYTLNCDRDNVALDVKCVTSCPTDSTKFDFTSTDSELPITFETHFIKVGVMVQVRCKLNKYIQTSKTVFKYVTAECSNNGKFLFEENNVEDLDCITEPDACKIDISGSNVFALGVQQATYKCSQDYNVDAACIDEKIKIYIFNDSLDYTDICLKCEVISHDGNIRILYKQYNDEITTMIPDLTYRAKCGDNYIQYDNKDNFLYIEGRIRCKFDEQNLPIYQFYEKDDSWINFETLNCVNDVSNYCKTTINVVQNNYISYIKAGARINSVCDQTNYVFEFVLVCETKKLKIEINNVINDDFINCNLKTITITRIDKLQVTYNRLTADITNDKNKLITSTGLAKYSVSCRDEEKINYEGNAYNELLINYDGTYVVPNSSQSISCVGNISGCTMNSITNFNYNIATIANDNKINIQCNDDKNNYSIKCVKNLLYYSVNDYSISYNNNIVCTGYILKVNMIMIGIGDSGSGKTIYAGGLLPSGFKSILKCEKQKKFLIDTKYYGQVVTAFENSNILLNGQKKDINCVNLEENSCSVISYESYISNEFGIIAIKHSSQIKTICSKKERTIKCLKGELSIDFNTRKVSVDQNIICYQRDVSSLSDMSFKRGDQIYNILEDGSDYEVTCNQSKKLQIGNYFFDKFLLRYEAISDVLISLNYSSIHFSKQILLQNLLCSSLPVNTCNLSKIVPPYKIANTELGKNPIIIAISDTKIRMVCSTKTEKEEVDAKCSKNTSIWDIKNDDCPRHCLLENSNMKIMSKTKNSNNNVKDGENSVIACNKDYAFKQIDFILNHGLFVNELTIKCEKGVLLYGDVKFEKLKCERKPVCVLENRDERMFVRKKTLMEKKEYLQDNVIPSGCKNSRQKIFYIVCKNKEFVPMVKEKKIDLNTYCKPAVMKDEVFTILMLIGVFTMGIGTWLITTYAI